MCAMLQVVVLDMSEFNPEVEEARKRDPITCYQARLIEKGILTIESAEAIEQSVADEVAGAIERADSDGFPDLDDRFNDVLVEKYPLEK